MYTSNDHRRTQKSKPYLSPRHTHSCTNINTSKKPCISRMSTFQALRKAGLDLKGNKPKGGRIFLTKESVILQLEFKHESEL